MVTWEEKIRGRELEACHVMVASLLSGFSEIGVLNQGVVTNITKKLASNLKAWFDATGQNPGIQPGDSSDARIKKIIQIMNEALSLVGEVSIQETPEGPAILITASKCRICPIGVGEAEIPGTACPFPGLFTYLVKLYSPDGKGIKVIPHDFHILTKKEGVCYLYFGEDA